MATATNATLLGNADTAGEAAYIDAHADTIADAYDAGAGAGYVEIRTGTAPAVGAAATGTLLATVTYQDPAFGAASAGVCSLNGTPNNTAAADGTAGWFRGYDSDSTTVEQGNCGATSSGAEMELDNTSITTGDTVTVTTHTITSTASTS